MFSKETSHAQPLFFATFAIAFIIGAGPQQNILSIDADNAEFVVIFIKFSHLLFSTQASLKSVPPAELP